MSICQHVHIHFLIKLQFQVKLQDSCICQSIVWGDPFRRVRYQLSLQPFMKLLPVHSSGWRIRRAEGFYFRVRFTSTEDHITFTKAPEGATSMSVSSTTTRQVAIKMLWTYPEEQRPKTTFLHKVLIVFLMTKYVCRVENLENTEKIKK